ncbi:MAG: IS607 family transposase [Clostridiaceae bacterium]|nr:IS607 family transposase [Clostridiaceae bacterium]
MKTREVLQLLQISRPTLSKYVKEKIIKISILPNGRYDYDKDSIYKLFNKGVERNTYLYARVSNFKQKPDLDNQVNMLKQFCFSNGYIINGIFTDIGSGISFEKRDNFFQLLDRVLDGKVQRVVITYKDRLSRVGFELFYHLFRKYNTEIIIMSEAGSQKLDSEEVFEEVVSLLHSYSMKLYSSTKRKKVKELIGNDEDVVMNNKIKPS